MISNLLAPGAAGWAVPLSAGCKLKGEFNWATAKTRSRRPSGDERRKKERECISIGVDECQKFYSLSIFHIVHYTHFIVYPIHIQVQYLNDLMY